MKKILIAAGLIVVLLVTPSLADDLVFENDIVKFVLTSKMTNKSLLEMNTQKEWLREKPGRFF